MWFPSQFPLTLQLVKQKQSGEFLPEPIQLSRLGFGRTRAVFSLPASALPNTPEEGVLKLCMVRQHHGKESEWGAHCSLVAPTYLKGQISVDFGVQARYLHFSVQRKATLASNWVAQFGGNAHSRPGALCAVHATGPRAQRGGVVRRRPFKLDGPSAHPIPPDDLWGRGWVERPPQDPPPKCGELRECVSKFPSDPDRISSGSVRSQTTGLEGCLQNSSQQVRQVRCPPGK